MKELFRSRGIFMAHNAKELVTEQFTSLLTLKGTPDWPEDELTGAMLDPHFRCRQTGSRAPPPPAPGGGIPPPPGPPPAPPAPQYEPPKSRGLTDLAKLYSDDQKFNGDLYDVLNLKLNIFYDLCAKAGVPPDQYNTAFAIMLRGKARDFYYQHIAHANLTFEEMISRIRGYFHTPKNHQLLLNDWRTTLLTTVIASNPNKDLAQCLEIVITKLQRVYQGLIQNLGANEGNLAGQLVSACQGVPACMQVLVRPATTFKGVASELRNAVGVWMRCNHATSNLSAFGTTPLGYQTHLSQQNEANAFYTDRRYNRNSNQQPDRRPDRSNNRPNTDRRIVPYNGR